MAPWVVVLSLMNLLVVAPDRTHVAGYGVDDRTVWTGHAASCGGRVRM
jgi:hypothetical protein